MRSAGRALAYWVQDAGLDAVGVVGHGLRTETAGHVHHDPVVGREQQRQEGVQNPHGPEDVRLIDVAQVIGGDVGHVLVAPGDAGVVDEHVEVADGRDGRDDGGVIGHVELDEGGSEVDGGLRPGFGVASGDPDVVALGDQTAGGLEPEALIGSGDQRGSHGSTLTRRRHAQPGTRRARLPGRQRRTLTVMDGLGGALRAWRERLTTADVGLPSFGRRRAPGLRREEVAALAGVSVDYLVRLEQGRARHPSAQVAEALARALRLDDTERDHLLHLAGLADPQPGLVPTRITPGVQRLLDRFGDAPVSVLDAAWNLLAWNPLWAALIGDPSSWHGRDRNLVWRAFTDRPSRVVLTDAEHEQWRSGLVADLRLVLARYPDDPSLAALVGELNRTSEAFAALWATGGVGVQAAARKTFLHPDVGHLTLDCDVLVVQGTDLRVVAYTAVPSSADAEALALIGILGLQTVS